MTVYVCDTMSLLYYVAATKDAEIIECLNQQKAVMETLSRQLDCLSLNVTILANAVRDLEDQKEIQKEIQKDIHYGPDPADDEENWDWPY